MKRVFILFIIFCLLSLPISGALLDPQIQILDKVIYRLGASVNGYINLNLSQWDRDWMNIIGGAGQTVGIGIKTSYIKPNTFYRFEFRISYLDEGGSQTLGNYESGVIDINNLTNLRFLPLHEWEDVEMPLPTVKTDIAILQEDWQKALIPSDYVTAYWDHILDTYYVLFYIPEDFYNQNVELFMQTFAMFNLGVCDVSTNVTVREITSAYIDDPIYNVLQEIKNNLASSGGGLSEEDIKNAVEDALNDHDDGLIDKVEEALQDFADQVTNTFGNAISSTENIKNSLSNFANVFSYSGTDCVLTFPEARNPLTNNSLLWGSHDIDIGQTYSAFPSALTSALKVFLDALIAMAVIDEVISIVQLTTFGGREDG